MDLRPRALPAPGNDGEVVEWDSTAAGGTRNVVLNEAKAAADLLGWSYDPVNANTNSVLTVATRHLSRIPLRRQLSVTNLVAYLGVAQNSLTHCFGALLKSDGTLIGQTADYATNWAVSGGATVDGNAAGVGLKVMVLAGGPFTVTPLGPNDFVWGVLYHGTNGGTAPSFARSASSLANALLNAGTTASRARTATQALADTATITGVTPASNSLGSFAFWMGIS